MKFNLFFVDAFSSTPFRGNPTSVCYVNTLPSPGQMQTIAAELNLPVSVFICKRPEHENHYDIRYFTPITEIPACGHGTLGAARIAMMMEQTGLITFHTAEGRALAATARKDNIMMSYPRFDWRPTQPEKETLQSLGIDHFLAAAFSPELETLFIEIESAAQLKNIQPDYARMVQSSNTIAEVVVTTASDDPNFDYLLRSFCPWIGIDEDPVTGSVHSVLGVYWQHRLQKNKLKAYQASQRSGEILIDASVDKIDIGGKTVIVMQGQLNY